MVVDKGRLLDRAAERPLMPQRRFTIDRLVEAHASVSVY
ncbi:hypothetical protein JOD54_005237 [Actinokineospora baliensis]|nr:hypothetical protein [Actinokineospora baliensis]